MKPQIAVTGASGLVGSALSKRIDITPIERPKGAPLSWSVDEGVSDDGRPLRAVVHLAGKSLDSGRWNETRKREMWKSRIEGTNKIVSWLAEREDKPDVLIAANSVGYFGDRGEEALPDDAAPGTGFLAELCAAWEAAALEAEDLGIRTVSLRFGLIVAPEGGLMGRMSPIFKLGFGAPLASGQQWFPWVHVDDVIDAIVWAIENDQARGAYNVVSPGIVRNAEFTEVLGDVLHRPTIMRAPRIGLKVLFGEMTDEVLLASHRARPVRLGESGFTFKHPELEPALRSVV